jgi:5'-3' exonuclease
MKINVIFDANYLFRKTLGIFAGYGAVDPNEVFAKTEDKAAFIRKVTMDMCATLRSLPPANRIIMCLDSSSWRKKIEIEGGGYKSDRKKDENIDWSIFYSLIHEYCLRLEDLGYVYTKVTGAEADDLIYFWTRYLMKAGENSIVITGDRDLHQLIKINENDNWVCVLNNNSKNLAFYTPHDWKKNIGNDEVSIFNMSGSIDPIKGKLREFANSFETNEIDSTDILLEKVLSGDKGDSVPPIWSVLKNGKNHGITPKKVEAFSQELKNSKWSAIPVNQLLCNPESIDFIAGYCLRSLGDVDSGENRIKVSENLERNKKLVWLEKDMIPKEISLEILSRISDDSDKAGKTQVPIDRDTILNGTEWVTEGYVPKKFDPFNL